MMESPIIKGNEWARLWLGDDGLEAAFDHIKRTYFERAGMLTPDQSDQYHALALASRVVDMVKAHAYGIIETGQMADLAEKAKRDIEELTPYQRKIRGI